MTQTRLNFFNNTPILQSLDDLPSRHVEPLHADPWVTSSLLNKAIRRGDAEMAERAALALFKYRGNGIWRRLSVIAFEDVGAGSGDIVHTVTAVTADASWRRQHPAPERLAGHLARLLADAPKDRSADYLICSAKDHPALEEVRERCGCVTVEQRLAMVADLTLPLPARATAAWYASGVEWGDEKRFSTRDLPGLAALYIQLGAPAELVQAMQHATALTREPIVVMVPLVWLAAFNGTRPSVSTGNIPKSRNVGGIPLYAFDKHTRLGKRAIGLFVRECEPVRACLEALVPDFHSRRAGELAAFYADAAPVAQRLDWPLSHELERLGTENDLLLAGVPTGGLTGLLKVVRDNLDHLNAIRARLLEGAQK